MAPQAWAGRAPLSARFEREPDGGRRTWPSHRLEAPGQGWGWPGLKLGELLRARAQSRGPSSAPPATPAAGGEGGDPGPGGDVRWVETDRVHPGRFQARQHVDESELQELAESIKAYGLLQPLVVRATADGYELVAGERRWRAARLAGLARVPVVVREADDRTAAALGLIENLQRSGLHFLEEAEGYRRLVEEFGLTQEEVARQVGKSQSAVANKLRLLKLPGDVREVVRACGLGERHARALLRLEDPEKQKEAARRMADMELSAAKSEELVGRMVAPRARRRVRGAYGDVRIFVNGLRQVVRKARQAGFEASMEERESPDGWSFEIRLGRNARERSRRG